MAADDQVNILLVDDQPSKLLSYEVILGELGDNLLKANSAREALQLLLKNEVAVILVDVCMPELDGFELVNMLREHPRYEKTAIIFVSAVHLSDQDLVRGYDTGAVDYVPVPVVPEILRAKVRIFAELWRKTRQLERLNSELERRVKERTTALETSAIQLHDSSERLRLASEAAGFGTYDYNTGAGQLYWSSYLRNMVGMSGEDPLTVERILEVVHPEHHQAVRQHVLGPEPEGPHELEFQIIRPDGEIRWLLGRGQSMPEERGRRVMGTILDITERKRTEERQRLLMAELDHRVKNILSNVSAVARLSSRSAVSVKTFVESLEGRIQAMSQAHGLLRRGAWEGANLADLANEALRPFLSGRDSNIEIEGEPIKIVPELAQSMALILHELATNAVKHGAMSSASGRVNVSWTRPAAGTLHFVWRESGGPAPVSPAVKGFGLSVLESAAADLEAVAEYGFENEGFVYTLRGRLELVSPSERPHAQPSNSARPASKSAAAGPTPSCRILIVEDEALVALQLQGDLEDDGHEVVGPARSLKDGLALAAEESIDAALVDVSLGRETSAPIADQLLARKIPFAFATGYSDAAMLPEHLRNIPKLSKPYVIKEIRHVLASLMAAE
jgi:PAS domain S-box-containing protein